jgi:AcrR family transcriptional regulator
MSIFSDDASTGRATLTAMRPSPDPDPEPQPAATPRRRRDAPRKGDLRERAILDTAEALLEHEPVEAITVEAIARGAGISRAALYFYFGSKQEVLAALVARTLAALEADARVAARAAAADAPPVAVVAAAVRGTAAQWRDHGRVMRVAVENAAAIPEVGRLWNATMARSIEAMTGVLIRAGLPEGDAPDGAAALAQALCWMTERRLYVASAHGGAAALDAAARSCTEVWTAVISSPARDGGGA